MSIDNPPLYSGITFNRVFFEEDTGLSQAQANALYLRKTFADTASAIETFNGGIKTASMDSTSSSTNMTIGSNLSPSQTVTLGSTGTITVNNGTLQSQSLAPVAPGTNLAIGASSTSTVSIGNAGVSTTNLYGTNLAGTINSFTPTGTLNLGSTLTTGTLNIGTATSTNYIYNLESPSASTNINLYSLLSGANLTLCDGQGTGNFGLGNDSARTGGVNICTKGLGYTSNTINIGAPSNIINVGAQVNRTGLISIGSNSASTSSSGGLSLGSVSSGTGSVQLANGTSQTANIIIGNGNAVVSGSDKIIIGKSGKTNTISGATTLDNGTLNLSNATINVNSPLTTGYSSSAITSSSMIGFTVRETITTSTFTSGAFTDAFAPITLPAGVWLIYYSLRFVSSGTSTLGDVYTFSNSGPFDPILQISGSQLGGVITASGITYNGTFVVSSTGSTTYTVQFVCNFSGSTVTLQSGTGYSSSIRRVRIA